MRGIDVKTFEIVEYARDDWEDLKVDPQTGYWTDPEGHTCAGVMTCESCGQEIPEPPTRKDMSPEEETAVNAGYKCPRCQKLANPPSR